MQENPCYAFKTHYRHSVTEKPIFGTINKARRDRFYLVLTFTVLGTQRRVEGSHAGN